MISLRLTLTEGDKKILQHKYFEPTNQTRKTKKTDQFHFSNGLKDLMKIFFTMNKPIHTISTSPNEFKTQFKS